MLYGKMLFVFVHEKFHDIFFLFSPRKHILRIFIRRKRPFLCISTIYVGLLMCAHNKSFVEKEKKKFANQTCISEHCGAVK